MIRPAAVPNGHENLRVFVIGEVHFPGVHYVPNGSKIADVIVAAGGMTRLAWSRNSELVRTNGGGQAVIIRARDWGLDRWFQIPVTDGDQIEIAAPRGE